MARRSTRRPRHSAAYRAPRAGIEAPTDGRWHPRGESVKPNASPSAVGDGEECAQPPLLQGKGRFGLNDAFCPASGSCGSLLCSARIDRSAKT